MAQFLPDAPELLAAIRTLLHDHVLPAVPADLQHRVRVAANLAGILEREARSGRGLEARERDLIGDVVGRDLALDDDAPAQLDEHLRGGVDDAEADRIWQVLVAICRDDLAVCKPGHDAYEGV